jgi:hypothetical protein
MATDDMYNSPYFGRMSSGSTGRAMDKAYEQYKGSFAPAGRSPNGISNEDDPVYWAKAIADVKDIGLAPALNNTPAPFNPNGKLGVDYMEAMGPNGPIKAPMLPAGLSYAAGGIANLGSYSDGGRLLRGPGDGVSDSIPAMIGKRQPARLADGEFVVPARIVSELGNGSTEAGARKLYAMMDRIKKARSKAKNIAADTKADKHLPA